MALQINPASIPSVPLANVTPVDGTGGTTATTQITPQYQLNFAGLTRSSALGLSAPTSAGDLEILFAQISAALKDQLGALGNADTVAQAQTRRNQLGSVMAAAQFLLGAGNAIDVQNDNIAKQQKIIDDQTVIRDAAIATRTALEASKSAKEQQIAANSAQISANNGVVRNLTDEQTRLNAELGRLKLPNDATRISQINARLAAIPGEISAYNSFTATLQGNNVQLQNEINGINGQIAAQKQIIEDAEKKIADATVSRDASKAEVSRLTTMMKNFVALQLPMLMLLAGKTKSEVAADSGQVSVEGDTFELLLSNAAQALVRLGEALAEAQAGADVVANTNGAGLNLDQATPDRFGQASAPVARAMVFAGLVAGTLAAVADVLRSLSAGLAMQSAGSFANEGAARMRVPV